ncbi:HlyD family secretion protein [Zavarzinia sp. CC-PAN008]|uniref:HlyD family secretion protein n=1 Tax=Zavarzinia sp. CC-PAN008 TaxID=3243332 RepID=UPI003F7496E2
MRRGVLAGVLIVFALVVGAGVYWYISTRHLVSTDDAYIHADIAPIGPKVAGYVAQVLVSDNQMVKAGDVLVRLDAQEFEARVAEAEATVAARQAALSNLESRLASQGSMINAAQAEQASAAAELRRARRDRDRMQPLANSQYVSRQRFDTLEADLAKAQAAGNRASAMITAQQGALSVIESERGELQAMLRQAEAALDLARQDLDHAVIRAPVDGVVGNRSVVPGQYVRVGARIMAVVPLHALWVEANYKETQLGKMRLGQPVTITVDAYPDLVLRGHVESLAPASGALFSLLPPENATGNFTKVVQRVPVRIVLDDLGNGMLRPGLSVHATVDTSAPGTPPQAGAALASVRDAPAD